jgi:hypothetical protein
LLNVDQRLRGLLVSQRYAGMMLADCDNLMRSDRLHMHRDAFGAITDFDYRS